MFGASTSPPRDKAVTETNVFQPFRPGILPISLTEVVRNRERRVSGWCATLPGAT